MELRDELLALRETTAQSYGHAEALKARWADLDKAQTSLYQVGHTHLPAPLAALPSAHLHALLPVSCQSPANLLFSFSLNLSA